MFIYASNWLQMFSRNKTLKAERTIVECLVCHLFNPDAHLTPWVHLTSSAHLLNQNPITGQSRAHNPLNQTMSKRTLQGEVMEGAYGHVGDAVRSS